MKNNIDKISMKYREKIIEEITKELLNVFSENEILSGFVYGSTLCEDFCTTSDFDILIIFFECELEKLEKLKQIKEYFINKNIKIDFNVHTKDDIPKNRKEVFWHNNRSIYFRKELELYGRAIIGENVLQLSDYDKNLMKLEVVRVLNSLVYQARKYLINKSNDRDNAIQILKWCIYAAQYSLAYKGIFPPSKEEVLNTFPNIFKTQNNPRKLFDLKISTEVITHNDIKEAYGFLCEVDAIIFEDYKKTIW